MSCTLPSPLLGAQPWRDIFMDQVVVTNPTWVIAAPILVENKQIGAIIWLSHSRLNMGLLAQSAKISIPPLLYAIAQQLQRFSAPSGPGPANAATGAWLATSQSADALSRLSDEAMSSLWQQVLCNAQSTGGSRPGSTAAGTAIPSTTGGSRPGSAATTATKARSQTSGRLASVASAGDNASEDSDLSFADFRPVRLNVSKGSAVSTHTLMRTYQTAITQHQRASPATAAEATGGIEEIEVIAKAGQVWDTDIHIQQSGGAIPSPSFYCIGFSPPRCLI